MTLSLRSGWWPSGRVLLAASLIGLMLLGIIVTWALPERTTGTVQILMHTVRGLGFHGTVIFSVLQILLAVSGILPASLLAMAAGAIYGLLPGFLLAAGGTLAGAILSFFLSRSLFRGAIERISARRPRLRNLDALIARDGWKLVCLLRVSPVMPFSATSFALGLSPIGLRDYMLGTLASLPALCGYVFIGTLADTTLSTWASSTTLVHWMIVGAGGLATLVLVMRLGQIAVKLGIVARRDLELTPSRQGGVVSRPP